MRTIPTLALAAWLMASLPASGWSQTAEGPATKSSKVAKEPAPCPSGFVMEQEICVKRLVGAAGASGRAEALAELEKGKELAGKESRRFSEAIPHLERALKLDPALAEAHLYLGTCHARSGDPDQGALHYEEYLHADPKGESAPSVRSVLRDYFKSKPDKKPRWPIG